MSHDESLHICFSTLALSAQVVVSSYDKPDLQSLLDHYHSILVVPERRSRLDDFMNTIVNTPFSDMDEFNHPPFLLSKDVEAPSFYFPGAEHVDTIVNKAKELQDPICIIAPGNRRDPVVYIEPSTLKILASGTFADKKHLVSVLSVLGIATKRKGKKSKYISTTASFLAGNQRGRQSSASDILLFSPSEPTVVVNPKRPPTKTGPKTGRKNLPKEDSTTEDIHSLLVKSVKELVTGIRPEGRVLVKRHKPTIRLIVEEDSVSVAPMRSRYDAFRITRITEGSRTFIIICIGSITNPDALEELNGLLNANNLELSRTLLQGGELVLRRKFGPYSIPIAKLLASDMVVGLHKGYQSYNSSEFPEAFFSLTSIDIPYPSFYPTSPVQEGEPLEVRIENICPDFIVDAHAFFYPSYPYSSLSHFVPTNSPRLTICSILSYRQGSSYPHFVVPLPEPLREKYHESIIGVEVISTDTYETIMASAGYCLSDIS